MEDEKFMDLAAKYLLIERVVKLDVENPFTWASGWKSPIYCDNRVLLSVPWVRTFFVQGLASIMEQCYQGKVDVIAGVSTSGIPWASFLADRYNLPLIYVRPEPKNHGKGNTIEGRLKQGQKVLVIEDLISTGGSSLKVVNNIRDAGGIVLGLVAIFQYGFPVAENSLVKSNVSFTALTNYPTLLQTAVEEGYINLDQLELLLNWSLDPANWRNDLKER